MRQKIANHKGKDNWRECGPCAPLPVGPVGERHTRSGMLDDEGPIYGIYFSTPGHRPMVNVHADDIEVTYAGV